MSDIETARAAKKRLRTELAGWGSLRGVGLARRDGGWVVQVAVRSEHDRPAVAEVVDGVPVRVRVTDGIHAQPQSGAAPQRTPAAGGDARIVPP